MRSLVWVVVAAAAAGMCRRRRSSKLLLDYSPSEEFAHVLQSRSVSGGDGGIQSEFCKTLHSILRLPSKYLRLGMEWLVVSFNHIVASYINSTYKNDMAFRSVGSHIFTARKEQQRERLD